MEEIGKHIKINVISGDFFTFISHSCLLPVFPQPEDCNCPASVQDLTPPPHIFSVYTDSFSVNTPKRNNVMLD